MRFKSISINGGCSSVGRVSDCDSDCRGFEPHQPPQINPCYYTLAILTFDEKESIAKVFSPTRQFNLQCQVS